MTRRAHLGSLVIWLTFSATFCVTVPRAAHAQTEDATSLAVEATGSREQRSGSAGRSLTLETEGLDAHEVEALRAGLERELNRHVAIGRTTESSAFERLLVVRTTERSLRVQLTAPERDPLERTVSDPAVSQERVDLLVLLGASMARDTPIPSAPTERTTPQVQAGPQTPPEPVPEVGPGRQLDMPTVPGHFSIFHPVATNANEPTIRTHFSLSLFQGRMGRLEGFAFGGYQSASHGVSGVQVAYVANLSRARVEGAQFAIISNTASTLEGLQLGGVNVNSGEEVSFGAQGGLVNVSESRLEGAQIGLMGNYAGNFRGLAIGGVGNIARNIKGVQATFGVNVGRDIVGLQLGAINVARKVRGAQIALINVADDVKGAPIGLISVTRSGGVHPSAWYSLASGANVGVRFAAHVSYSVLLGSYDIEGERAGPGYELGFSIPIVRGRVFTEVSLGETITLSTQSPDTEWIRSLSELRGSLRVQILRHLGLFVGAGYVGKVERALIPMDGIEIGQWYYQGSANFTAGIVL